MSGPGFAFEVQPQILTAYGDALHARVAELAMVGAVVAEMRVEPRWFGKLPAAELLAERCAARRDADLAELGELGGWLAEAARGLAESAGRYSA
ncbi:hypothetical protein, partial [Catenulispora pinisilvae]|uniref:hypothetical protein n=1 Tax=Catenulispora pinisilvae TaxID=2705253 RepID=UPI0018927B52